MQYQFRNIMPSKYCLRAKIISKRKLIEEPYLIGARKQFAINPQQHPHISIITACTLTHTHTYHTPLDIGLVFGL